MEYRLKIASGKENQRRGQERGFAKGLDELIYYESCFSVMKEFYTGLRPASLRHLSEYTYFWRLSCGQLWVFFCLCGEPVT
jgi:hypothetical protein